VALVIFGLLSSVRQGVEGRREEKRGMHFGAK
jgi:hypothetical protein